MTIPRWRQAVALNIVLFLLAILLPLAGPILRHQPLGPYLRFPPRVPPVAHAPFHRGVFWFGCLAATVGSMGYGWLLASRLSLAERGSGRFPGWGWLGVVMMLGFWYLAWHRFSWFAPLQPYTFSPLWLGFILTLNGLCVKYHGQAPLTREPYFFLSLFPVSALFWWYFEWLNRFVGNWSYLGVESFGTIAYVVHATICFATVLPAIHSMEGLLAGFWRNGRWSGPVRLTSLHPVWGWVMLGMMALVLALLDVWPDQLFPFVWLAPLLLFVGAAIADLAPGVARIVAALSWQDLLLWPLAALLCGFFWELWNWRSLPRWQYSVPYVDGCHIFAMPLLGYLGYLPFGLECWLVCQMARQWKRLAFRASIR